MLKIAGISFAILVILIGAIIFMSGTMTRGTQVDTPNNLMSSGSSSDNQMIP